uniref:Uncharacterized protein n=1 Tax=Macaca fascicularis TaxID=9541 RepID=Q9GMJ6_MACFA|nr:hypothetical protein [Macaca fascicularis]
MFVPDFFVNCKFSCCRIEADSARKVVKCLVCNISLWDAVMSEALVNPLAKLPSCGCRKRCKTLHPVYGPWTLRILALIIDNFKKKPYASNDTYLFTCAR